MWFDQAMCLFCMYYCKGTQVSFLEMVECKMGDANHLFELLKDVLSNNSITKENLVGLDTTNVMAGAHNSIFTKTETRLSSNMSLEVLQAINFIYQAPGLVKSYQII